MANEHPVDPSIEAIFKALMKEADELSFSALVRKAIAEGVRIGEAEAWRRLAQLAGGNAALPERPVSGALPPNPLGSPGKQGRAKGEPAKGPPAKKQHIQCPVKGCTRPGNKPLHNFCQYHYQELPPKEREKLRVEQIARQRNEKQKQRAAEKAQREAERERKAGGKTAA